MVAALGAITAVFTKGWGSSLLGLPGTGPVDAFLPVVMFSVLFGLSMDYEVYTVSRMQEEWQRLRSRPEDPAWRNHAAVTAGQAHSTRIVTAAAAIMILVFGSFLPGGHHLLQEFGFGLGFSVLIDAILIRSMLLPAVMHLTGPANWYLPARLARALPRLDIEAGEPGAPGETGGADGTVPGLHGQQIPQGPANRPAAPHPRQRRGLRSAGMGARSGRCVPNSVNAPTTWPPCLRSSPG